MNEKTFTTAMNYLSEMPCGLKRELLDSSLKEFCDPLFFVGLYMPIKELETENVVGTAYKITLLDKSTKRFLTSGLHYLSKQELENNIREVTNLIEIADIDDPVLEKLKTEGYREVNPDWKRRFFKS